MGLWTQGSEAVSLVADRSEECTRLGKGLVLVAQREVGQSEGKMRVRQVPSQPVGGWTVEGRGAVHLTRSGSTLKKFGCEFH
jgi:hypothetical protein